MKNHLEVVKEQDGDKGFAVKTQIRKNGHWYTAADVHCVPNLDDASEIGQIIADALNKKYEENSNRRNR